MLDHGHFFDGLAKTPEGSIGAGQFGQYTRPNLIRRYSQIVSIWPGKQSHINEKSSSNTTYKTYLVPSRDQLGVGSHVGKPGIWTPLLEYRNTICPKSGPTWCWEPFWEAWHPDPLGTQRKTQN